MALTFLESWSAYAEMHLMVGHMPRHIVDDLARAYPNARIYHRHFEVARRAAVRISQKMLYWDALTQAVQRDAPDFMILADIDTVAVIDPRPMCLEDIVVTVRRPGSVFFLNSGVVSLSRRAILSDFVCTWRDRTQVILSSPELLTIATSVEQPYGGGDQYSLMELIGANTSDLQSYSGGRYHELMVRTVACGEFNACENVIDARKARILHLKSSLQNFLLRRRPLIGERRMEDSLYQLRAAVDANHRGLSRLRSVGVEKLAAYHFSTPLLMRRDLTVPRPVTAAYRMTRTLRGKARAVGARIAQIGQRND